MKKLTDFVDYLKNKIYVKMFESNPKNYMGKPKTLLATSGYCNAVTDIIIYENSW